MNIQLNGANSKNERDRIDYERAMLEFEQDKKTVSHKHIYELFEGYEGNFVSEEIDDFPDISDDELKELYREKKAKGDEKMILPEIENWGFACENEVMKGYVLYALEEMKRNTPELQLSEAQKDALMVALNWATSDMTAQEAYKYYLEN